MKIVQVTNSGFINIFKKNNYTWECVTSLKQHAPQDSIVCALTKTHGLRRRTGWKHYKWGREAVLRTNERKTA